MLGDCHESLLQRIIDRSDGEDFFLQRQVSRRFRTAVNARVRSAIVCEIPYHLSSFPGLRSLTFIEDNCLETEFSWLGAELARLPHLQELLHLVPGIVDPASDEVAPALGQLTRLSLECSEKDSRCSDFLLGLAARCSSLQRLQIYHGQLSWEVIHEALDRLGDSLTDLELTDVRLPPTYWPRQGLEGLSTRNLKTLRFRTFQYDSHDVCVLHELYFPDDISPQLTAFTGLTSLDLHGQGFAFEAGCLNALTGLTQLRLGHAAMWEELVELTRLTGLLDLDVSHSMEGEEASPTDALAGFPSLTKLDLSGCELGGRLSLAAQPHLRSLVANRCQLSELAPALADLPELRELRLAEASCEPGQMAQLSCLSGLTRLSLLDLSDPQEGRSSTSFGVPTVWRADLEWLAGLTALHTLSLSGRSTTLVRGALPRLAGLGKLQALDLGVASLEQPAELALLERLPLVWLRLPYTCNSADQLPPGLKVPFLRGLEHCWVSRMQRLHPDWSPKCI